MSLQTNSALLSLRLRTPSESATQRSSRVARSIQVARQMIKNGHSVNSALRYTGLKEEELRGA